MRLSKCLIMCLLVLSIASCSPLSKAQLEAVRELSFRSDTVSRSPVILFSEMADIRLERGLFYASSLSSPDARLEEVTALAEESMDSETLSRKAEAYVDAMNAYVRALHSISTEARWKGAGTALRGIGTRIDSAVAKYNDMEIAYEALPTGYARMAGRILGYVAEEIMQVSQAVAVKNIVITGDTLIAASCDSLMEILKSDGMDELIRHEKESVKDNYSAYVRALMLEGRQVPMESDRQYIELSRRVDRLSDIRNSCVSAIRSLKNAHSRLAEDFASGRKDIEQELWDELVRFNRLASQVYGKLEQE